ncbi:hypothetical protein EV361DRAFT_813405, partial [Lentinula raphanica]
VLHPSHKLEYFNSDNADWPQSWIDGAVAVTRETWERMFKPTALRPEPGTPSTAKVSLQIFCSVICSHCSLADAFGGPFESFFLIDDKAHASRSEFYGHRRARSLPGGWLHTG